MASNINGFLPQSVGNTDTTAEVNLLPCLHRVKKVFAESHYGPMVNGVYNLTGKVCDVCKKPVVGWNQDIISVVLKPANNTRVVVIDQQPSREPDVHLGSTPHHSGGYVRNPWEDPVLDRMHYDFHSE